MRGGAFLSGMAGQWLEPGGVVTGVFGHQAPGHDGDLSDVIQGLQAAQAAEQLAQLDEGRA